jgi:hypothetical protein
MNGQHTKSLGLLLAGVLIVASLAFLPGKRDSTAAEKADEPVRFTEQLIRDKYGYAYGIAAADLDGDGDIDLVSSDTTDDKTPSKDNGTLLWYENDGKGNFTQHVISQNENGWFERLAIGDIDGDGRPDVVVVLNRAGGVVWFQNPGKPTTGSWKRHVICDGKLPGAYDVAIGDFDGGGDRRARVQRTALVEQPRARQMIDDMAWRNPPGPHDGPRGRPLPRQAAIADKLALVRSLHFVEPMQHELEEVYTDFPKAAKRPAFGSVISRFRCGDGTDSRAERPRRRAPGAQNVIGTVYHALGIDYREKINDFSGRPMQLLDDGEPIEELVG